MIPESPQKTYSIQSGSLINVLGVVYVHQKTSDGGDIYLTRYGLPFYKHLQIENWYEKRWFESYSIRLEGTSSVYRIPTREVDGKSVDLVVKNCRVGEDVPVQTKTILDFINAEFNSPWEEFSLVLEMKEGKFGPIDTCINTQRPLAIYVPPEMMQPWQSGRSIDKINRIIARHPGIDVDILKQYKLIYGWIYGKDILELFSFTNTDIKTRYLYLVQSTESVINDLRKKGFVIADMKPAHIVISDEDIAKLQKFRNSVNDNFFIPQPESIADLVYNGHYSVVDYELLVRTPEYEELITTNRRINYHEGQMHRFAATEIPAHLHGTEILGLHYIHGRVESTGGQLWVVGKNATLFDYFLPERWRKTHAWRLSLHNHIYYTISKDHIHIVWKISRVGEKPEHNPDDPYSGDIVSYGYNSPFEEFSIAYQLNNNHIPTVYIRAIYMTGSAKLESSDDLSRYQSHCMIKGIDGSPVLCKERNYITIRGFYNGPDDWVAQQKCLLCRPLDLQHALVRGYIGKTLLCELRKKILKRLFDCGFDGTFLKYNDLLVVINPHGKLILDEDGDPEIRICNFELIKKL